MNSDRAPVNLLHQYDRVDYIKELLVQRFDDVIVVVPLNSVAADLTPIRIKKKEVCFLF